MSKIILITGTSTGFGRDTAETLARAGHRVFASMRDLEGRNREHAETLRHLAREQGLAIEPVELDVTDTASVERAVQSVLRLSNGRIDVLINNAGVAAAGVTEAFTAEQATALFDVNVIGMMRTTRAVLPTLRTQGDGIVINIGSILGRVTFPFFGIYGATKFALEAITDSYHYELSQFGIEMVLVQPSAYPTQMYSSVQSPSDAARAASYGAVGEIPGAMFQHFMTSFQAVDAPNPHDVAEAIARLVVLPKGERPQRVVVGAPFGADQVNEQTVPVQDAVLQGLGLGHLDTLKVNIS